MRLLLGRLESLCWYAMEGTTAQLTCSHQLARGPRSSYLLLVRDSKLGGVGIIVNGLKLEAELLSRPLET